MYGWNLSSKMETIHLSDYCQTKCVSELLAALLTHIQPSALTAAIALSI